MRAQWARMVAFVNGMSLRERLLLFAAVVALLGALTDAFFISPLVKLQAQQAREIDKRSAAMEGQRNRLEMQLIESRHARAAELNEKINKVQAQIDAVERQIVALAGAPGDVAAQRSILTRVLLRTDKVALLRVTSAETVPAAGGNPAANAAAMGGGSLDITLAGAYLDLMEYLASLETAMPQARWSALKLAAETVPPQLTVRIVTPRGGS